MTRRLVSTLVLAALLSPPVLQAQGPEEFQGTFKDTVIQITFVKVGARVNTLYLGDIADSKHYLAVNEKFIAGQTIAYSVFARADYRVSLWGGGEPLLPRKSEPLDEPAGKGLKITYDDGTVIEVIA